MLSRTKVRIEGLEPRALLSAWSTVQDVGDSSIANVIGADAAGNVYAAGITSVGGVTQAVVREKSNGSANWNTMDEPLLGDAWSLTVDAKGDLFVGGANGWTIIERPAGKNTFSVVDSLPGDGNCRGLATDAAGDVFAAGNATISGSTHWVVRERAAGQTLFTTVDDFQLNVGNTPASTFAQGLCVIPSGASAGIYAVGGDFDTAEHWLVRKSRDGGKTWTTVDQFQYGGVGSSYAAGVAGDHAGNVFVVGQGGSSLTTKGRWIVRKSANGGTSWSIADNFQPSPTEIGQAAAVGSDLAGNMYVVGQLYDGAANHSIIRSNAGGSWATVDSYQLVAGRSSSAHGFATDAGGNLYAAISASSASNGHWVIRSAPGPLAAAAVSFKQTEGQNFSGQVATFTDPSYKSAGQFTATVNWGDGTPSSAGVISKSGFGWQVTGNHVYKFFGTYHATVSIKDAGGKSKSVLSTATIADAALHANGRTFTIAQATLGNTPQLLATFTDANSFSVAGDFTASISWGDGTTSVGTVKLLAGSRVFDVLGTHKYAAKKKYTVTLTITDSKGASKSTAVDTITVN